MMMLLEAFSVYIQSIDNLVYNSAPYKGFRYFGRIVCIMPIILHIF